MKHANFAQRPGSYASRWIVSGLLVCCVLCPAPAFAQKTFLKKIFSKNKSASTVKRFQPSSTEQQRLLKEITNQQKTGLWQMHRAVPAYNKKLAIQRHQQAAQINSLTEKEIASAAKVCQVPKLQKKPPVIIKNFKEFMPPVRMPSPYPLELYPGDLARGMLLLNPAQDLKTIFSQGLLVSRSAKDAAAQKNLIFMTNTPQIVHIYTCPQQPGVPVVVHISGFQGEGKSIWTTDTDIPPENIVRVSAYLRVNGKKRWGQIVPQEDGSFAFYPYELSLTQKARTQLLKILQSPR